MKYITIDPYYDVQFYNECKEALKNNDINFKTLIYVKQPYDWYFSVDENPVMVNYDEASTMEQRWLVNTVIPLMPNEEYLLHRRNNDRGQKAIAKFIDNEPLKEAREADYACFFNVSNRQDLQDISKEYAGKIWYMGKYYNNKFKVCIATHEAIKTYIDPDMILLDRSGGTMSAPGLFEAELNYKIFRLKDRLVKFTMTPYFENGKYNRPKILGDHSQKFLI